MDIFTSILQPALSNTGTTVSKFQELSHSYMIYLAE